MSYCLCIYDASGEIVNQEFANCYRSEVLGKLREFAHGKVGKHAQAYNVMKGGLAIESISIREEQGHDDRTVVRS